MFRLPTPVARSRHLHCPQVLSQWIQHSSISRAYNSHKMAWVLLDRMVLPTPPPLLPMAACTRLFRSHNTLPRFCNEEARTTTTIAVPPTRQFPPTCSSAILSRRKGNAKVLLLTSTTDFILPRKQSDKVSVMRSMPVAEWLPWLSQTLHRATSTANKSLAGALRTRTGSHLRTHRIRPFHPQATTATITAAP